MAAVAHALNTDELLTMEQALLGSAFYSFREARWLVANVPREAFARPAHQLIYVAISQITRGGAALDDQNLTLWLKLNQKLDEAGGVDYIASVVEQAWMHSNMRSYAACVIDSFAKRQVEKRALEILEACRSGEGVEKIRGLCFDMPRNLAGVGSDTILSSSVDLKRTGDLLPRISTGFSKVDGLTDGGYYSGEMSLIVGSRGTGKSAWMIGAAVTASRLGKKVGYATLEMPHQQLQRRMVQWISGWSKPPAISKELLAEYEEACDEVADFEVRWYDPSCDRTGDRYIDRLVAWAIDCHDSIGLDELFIDYGQKLNARGYRENRTRELDFVADEIEWLAKQLRIPVICGSQLTPDPKGNGPGRSKDSIRFEDNAALVMYLKRDRETSKTTCTIGKNRHGPEGQISLSFNGMQTRYFDLDEGGAEPQTREPQVHEGDPFADED